MTFFALDFKPLPPLIGTGFVALSTLIMAYSILVEVLPILVFYALWLPLLILRRPFLLTPSPDLLLLLSLPLLCCFSAFWSDYFVKTLYHGVQFASMIVCTIIIARSVDIDSLLKGLALGVTLVLAISLASGNYATDYFTGRQILVGYFGSKNIVGFFASVGVLTGLVLLLCKASLKTKLFFALPALAISGTSLALSHSASSYIAIATVIAGLALLACIQKLPRIFHWPALFALLCAALSALSFAIGFDLDALGGTLNILNRDPTLTGRTFLWAQGIENALVHPLLGHGYRAFWVPGHNPAEYLWEAFYITAKTGFHFHNFFIQAFVDLGAAGLALITLIILTTAFIALRTVLRYGMNRETAFLAGLTLMFLIRTIVEVDMWGPFGMGSMLFYMILPRLSLYARRKKRFEASEAN